MTHRTWESWIFDLDGTLTRAIHDFEAIRRELELPAGTPILEALEALPAGEAVARRTRLDSLEVELAQGARPARGASELLEALTQAGCRVGIVTRNCARAAAATLRTAGLDRFFREPEIMAREHAPPKPRPDGIELLLARWRTESARAVMVGDYRFDLEAGRAAGVATVYVDASARYPFADLADACVPDLFELRARLAP